MDWRSKTKTTLNYGDFGTGLIVNFGHENTCFAVDTTKKHSANKSKFNEIKAPN